MNTTPLFRSWRNGTGWIFTRRRAVRTGAPLDALKCLGRSAFPQMEFWAKAPGHRVKDEDRFFVKEASSAAHIYGKNIVAAEGFTSIGNHWNESSVAEFEAYF